MNLHEYQGKHLFAQYGLPVSKGYAVDTPQEAVEAADMIGGDMWVVKAQVHAGGRGPLAGGTGGLAAPGFAGLGGKTIIRQEICVRLKLHPDAPTRRPALRALCPTSNTIGNSDDWRLLYSENNNAADVHLGLMAQNNLDQTGSFNVAFDNLTITADNIIGLVPLPPSLWMAGAGLLGLMGLGWRRRRS